MKRTSPFTTTFYLSILTENLKSFKEPRSPIPTPVPLSNQRSFSHSVNITASPLKRTANITLAKMLLPDAELMLLIDLEVVDFGAAAEATAARY
jgi:hypothetical protein